MNGNRTGFWTLDQLEERQLLAATFLTAGATAMVYDEGGGLHVAYYDTADRTLKYTARAPSGAWDPAVTVDRSPGAGAELSIALDATGRPGIAYYDAGRRDLKLAQKGRRAWSVATVDSAGTVGHNPSLAFNLQGRPLISYHATSVSDLRLASFNGSQWSVTTVDSNGSTGRYSELAVNPADGTWAIAYERQDDRTVRYAQQGNRSFTTRVIDQGSTVTGWAAKPSLAFDAAGTPVVSYVDATEGSVVLMTGARRAWGRTATTAGAARGVDNTLYVSPYTGEARVVYTAPSGALALASAESAELSTVDLGGAGATASVVNDQTGAVAVFDQAGRATVVESGTTAAAAAAAVPLGVQATAAGRAHGMTVSWQPVVGAQSYAIQRSASGGSWVKAADVAGGVTRFDDWGLAEGTSYRYRVRARTATGWSAFSLVSTPQSTATFRLFDALMYENRPQPLATGAEPIFMEYSVRLGDEAWARQTARAAADAGQVLCLDIEHLPLDIRTDPVPAVDETIRQFNQMVGWMHNERPALKLGFYWNMPRPAPDDVDDPVQVQRWREADDYLIQQLAPNVDYVFPSFYATRDASPTAWSRNVWATVDSARRYGKPVYCFLRLEYEDSAEFLSPDAVRMKLAAVRALTDGVVMWGGYSQDWSAAAASTWAGAGPSPAGPVTLAAAPSGLTLATAGARLSWADNSGNEAGFVIERSSDGVNFRFAGAVERNVTTWADPKLSAGKSYVYRVAALTGAGLSAYTATVGGTVTRYAMIPNEAEGFEDGRDVAANARTVAHIDAGDYLVYRAVDFGTGADQFRARLGVPAESAGQRIEVRLDSLGGPLIAELATVATRGWADFAQQTVAAARTTGIHDVYLVFRGRADGSGGWGVANLDWWRFGSAAAPAPPMRLTTRAAPTGVQLNWADASADESGFRIQRSTDGVAYSPIATTAANVTTYLDTTATAGAKYWYRVTSANGTVASDPSNAAAGFFVRRDARGVVEAEAYDEMNGVRMVDGGNVGHLDNGDWLRFAGLDFGAQAATRFTARLGVPAESAGQQIEVRLDAADGKLVGTLTTTSTGWWYTYVEQSVAIEPTTGMHDVYLVFRGGYGVAALDSIRFGG